MKIFLGILAVICFIGMIGENEQKDRDNLTVGFVVTIASIVALAIMGV